MALKSAPLASWPWEWAKTYKYFLYVPLGAEVFLKYYKGESFMYDACFHILVISFLRCCIYEVWHTLSRSHVISKSLTIQDPLIEFEQVDRELDWDNYVILQALVAASAAQAWIKPNLISELPIMDWRGLVLLMLLHAGPTECIYYVVHRAFHSSKYLFNGYHSFHHLSMTPEPSTAGTGTFLEHVLLTAMMALPICGVMVARIASLGALYAYVLCFDFMKNMIHSNVEVMPSWPFQRLPLLQYLFITPSYHSLHHTLETENFCLFMPLYDYLGGTLNKGAFKLHQELRSKGREVVVPDSVFVPHAVDFIGGLHVGFILRTFSSFPRDGSPWWTFPLLPLVSLSISLAWIWGKACVVSHYTFHGVTHQTWSLPVLGFQYFLPNAFRKINKMLEQAILEADRKGVKVLTLGALNKNEAMNGGGLLFVNKHRGLKVRVCHGNTLTTAVILRELPEDVTEVFLTGSTSKIGKAMAVYLARKRVRVLMLTACEERFEAIKKEAPKDCQQYLIRATKYQAGQNCKTWIIGKWAGYGAQKLAPPGTHFYQFTLPPILHFRRDCSYSDSANIRLPEKLVRGINSCEHTMPRHVVHACHAGGLIHALEGWEHHEVGPVDVDQIDVVWEAATKHGLTKA